MVHIPAGTFMMGGADGDEDERPPHEVTLSGYSMDRTEVTVGAYAECVTAGACRSPDTGHLWNWGIAGKEEHPVNGVSWHDARAYCGWRGARLPSEAEWEYGARGRDGRRYPWGNEEPSDARLQWSGACGGGNCSGGTAAVGTHPGGRSAFGLDDMGGNVWEWVSDRYAEYRPGGVRDPSAPAFGEVVVARGGSWNDYLGAMVRATNRSWMLATFRGVNIGFRCARGAR